MNTTPNMENRTTTGLRKRQNTQKTDSAAQPTNTPSDAAEKSLSDKPQTSSKAPRRRSSLRQDLEPLVWFICLAVLLLAIGKWGWDHFPRSDANAEHWELLTRHWADHGESLLANVSEDPSFTKLHDARIFFRAMRRKFPVPGVSPTVYQTKVALVEVTDSDAWGAEVSGSATGWETKRKDVICVGRAKKVRFHAVALLSTGMRFTSSYMGEDGPNERDPAEHIGCMRRMMPLMCVGDKWEMVCPAEESFGEAGENAVPPNAVTIWRVSMEEVPKDGVGLDWVEAHLKEEAGITRRELYEKSKKYLSNSTVLKVQKK